MNKSLTLLLYTLGVLAFLGLVFFPKFVPYITMVLVLCSVPFVVYLILIANMESPSQKSFSVLIADEDVISVGPLLNILKGKKIKVDYVTSPKEAISKMEDNSYDLLFVDFHMHQLNSANLLSLPKSPVSDEQMPVIFFTNYEKIEKKMKSLQSFNMRIKDVWSKDTGYLELNERVEKVLENIAA